MASSSNGLTSSDDEFSIFNSAKKIIQEWLSPDKKMKRRAWPIILGAAYLILIYFLGGLRSDHVLVISTVLLDSYNRKTRLFLKYFFPFILTGIVYDSMRYFYWTLIDGRAHVSEPYYLEKKLFGIHEAGQVLTPNEFFQIHVSKVLDFFCGFAYLTFVIEYLSAGFLLFLSNRLDLLRRFGWSFFIVNVMGFITYYIYPAAPPWYVNEYGLGPARYDVHATPAAASRFDQLFGTHFFDAMYGKSVDVFGAIPSLHVSYPLLVVWVAFVAGRFRLTALSFFLLMCFSAIYLQHHYIIDAIFGVAYALIVMRAVKWYFDRKPPAADSVY